MRLAIITTHPIQYYAPIFKLMAEHKTLEIKVFYTLGETGLNPHDAGFGQNICWDIPLLNGYDFHFQKNTAKKPGSDRFWGIINPNLIIEIETWGANAILVYGWAYHAHLKAIIYFKNKIPIYFRGDSTLLNKKNTLKNSIKSLFLNWVYRHVDHAFYVGKNSKAYFEKFGLKSGQLSFAPHAIDNDRFAADYSIESSALRKKLDIAEDEILILFAGKLEKKKNPQLLLQTFEALSHPNMHLLFAGNGPLEKELKAQKVVLKTASRIYFLDFQNQSQMPTLYQACDLFCLPSAGPGETWGLAVNEAMACGKAILVSDQVGCAVNLIQPKRNGEIFKSENQQSILEKLQFLTRSKTMLTEYGKASLEIIQDWNFNKMVESITTKILES